MLLQSSLPLFLLAFLSTASACDATIDVTTSRGLVKGYKGSTANRFVLPYALPPVGSLRFADPVAVGNFDGLDASGLPPACAQLSSGSATTIGVSSTSEDCLFLSIYTTRDVKVGSKLPVFFWVHGGSGVVGATTVKAIDGAALAVKEKMIVVTVQYRLGALGLLKLDSAGIDGNYALKDVILALKFVQEEINNFGGDSTRVTLAGQSSGAEMIKTLLVTPFATPLFSRAILHSAPLNFGDLPSSTANAVGAIVAKSLGCTDIACFRSASVASILKAQDALYNATSTSFAPTNVAGLSAMTLPLHVVVDGKLVAKDFAKKVIGGESLAAAGKEIIFTTTRDEGCPTAAGLFQGPVPVAYFEPVVGGILQDRAAAVLNSGLYDPSRYFGDSDAVRKSLQDIATDYPWTCANQQSVVNITLNAGTRQKIYLAQFDLGISYKNGTIPFCVGKVSHEDDIYLLFGTSNTRLNAAERIVADELTSRWAAFAYTGTPNALGYHRWTPVSGPKLLNLLTFGAGANGASTIRQTYKVAECAVGSGLWGRAAPFDSQA